MEKPLNEDLVNELVSGVHNVLDPPGCSSSFLEHPVDRRRAVEVAVVHEHRFAFFYWMKWKHAQKSASLPDLVTIDWHDDVGGECDYTPRILESLNPRDENELGLFCWLGLRSINDGHIAPAAYLDAFQNVHAIVKQGWDTGKRERDGRLIDRNRREHRIEYHRSPAAFLRAFRKIEPGRQVLLDLDLDYFTRPDRSKEHRRQQRLSDDRIRQVLNPSGPLMEALLPRLAGMTIALEPEYCGGISNCVHLLDTVSDVLFQKPLLSAGCSWRL